MPKVLLAEDDVTMVRLLTTLLRMEGFEVASLTNFQEPVIEALDRERPDALILDVHLPGENGIDVLRAIRNNDSLKDTYVVMTSGMNLKIECMDDGANEFLLKPYMPDDLISALRRRVT
jgi:DNA-binding response OmpR family regulator